MIVILILIKIGSWLDKKNNLDNINMEIHLYSHSSFISKNNELIYFFKNDLFSYKFNIEKFIFLVTKGFNRQNR